VRKPLLSFISGLDLGWGVDIILIDILTIANISVVCSFCFKRFENGKRDEVQDYKEHNHFFWKRG
jgi:hypothetical protein